MKKYDNINLYKKLLWLFLWISFFEISHKLRSFRYREEVLIDIEDIDAFVLTPLNSNDFPIETLKFLKTFDVPIFISLQGFLRFKDENNSMILKLSDDLKYIFDIIFNSFITFIYSSFLFFMIFNFFKHLIIRS